MCKENGPSELDSLPNHRLKKPIPLQYFHNYDLDVGHGQVIASLNDDQMIEVQRAGVFGIGSTEAEAAGAFVESLEGCISKVGSLNGQAQLGEKQIQMVKACGYMFQEYIEK